MNIRLLLSPIFILISSIAFCQDYSFENKFPGSAERASFTLKGNKIIDGEWEHTGNMPNTSAEVYAFSGKKNGNKLIIVFDHPVPYILNTKSKKGEWSFSTKKLTIAMKKKNKIRNVVFKPTVY